MKFRIAEELSTFNFGTEFVNAGRSYEKKITEKDVDAEQLEMGINVEMEHTVNKDIAKKIYFLCLRSNIIKPCNNFFLTLNGWSTCFKSEVKIRCEKYFS